MMVGGGGWWLKLSGQESGDGKNTADNQQGTKEESEERRDATDVWGCTNVKT